MQLSPSYCSLLRNAVVENLEGAWFRRRHLKYQSIEVRSFAS